MFAQRRPTGPQAHALLTMFLLFLVNDSTALAQRGRANVRSTSRTSVNTSDVNRNANINRNVDVNRNTDVNRNVNVNRNIDTDRDVDIDVDHRYGACCYHDGWGTAAAVATTAAVTAAVVGSTVHSLPSSCSAVVVDGFTYQQCGSTWYQPRITSGSTTYIVVNPPR